ncbi:LysR substrate-binding domain-containing protein [Marinobacter sp. M216]|uniref:LysR substrate-binding domain-containing protein n=1 Tax=Marinobacter albus TaxID=3030833 RepID=A0ABT7H9E2_9GAMM|nr:MULTISPECIES: LysR substrate-binding domain-containing protein [unclassified Marinobacter]MBW7470786.1 LysR family transcriptional regulator [Marinobacter sp. F4218]MDK9556944.1 LysR substrate-binding domain-containing protein [Marinobacter sp. M216]
MPLLDNDVLRTFVAISECGTFTGAAKVVHRTPSALSMQIKQLERSLGKSLFVREPRQVRLTTEGEILLDYSRRLLRLNEEAVQHFIAPTLEGKVGIGTSDDVGTRILPEVLAQFARSYPAILVDVVVGSSKQNLARVDAGELDLALVTVADEARSIRGEVVHEEPLVWAGREGGAAFQRTPLPIAMAHEGCAWRRMTLRALDRAGIAYRIAYTCEHCSGQEAAMVADLAVAPFPQSLVRPPLKQFSSDDLPEIGSYQLALVRGRSTPVNDALATHVKEAFQSVLRASA